MKRSGEQNVATLGIETLFRDELIELWIHFDLDVLDDSIMPAVDYRFPGWISFAE